MRCNSFYVGLLVSAFFLSPASAAQQFVRVSADGRGFVRDPSGERFVPWGLNYGNGGRLIEDYWTEDWPTVERDFAQMKAIGANVVRVHLQVGKFMTAADRVNAQALDHLNDLLQVAEKNEMYLDLTGLACYRPKDRPAWYDDLQEKERWDVQSRFWEAIAQRCANSPAVFCYDLMNEPLSPGGKRKPRDYYSGALLGGYDFLQFISLDQGDRVREDIPPLWIDTLSAAIRKKDRRRLITVGLLPWDPAWHYLSGFVPEKVAPHLDFISVHIYPQAGKVPQALEGLHKFAVGKPVVIEETFPLACSANELREFLLKSKIDACGWVGHYDGKPIAQLESLKTSGKITVNESLWLDWLLLFRDMKTEMTTAPSTASGSLTPRPAADTAGLDSTWRSSSNWSSCQARGTQ